MKAVSLAACRPPVGGTPLLRTKKTTLMARCTARSAATRRLSISKVSHSPQRPD